MIPLPVWARTGRESKHPDGAKRAPAPCAGEESGFTRLFEAPMLSVAKIAIVRRSASYPARVKTVFGVF